MESEKMNMIGAFVFVLQLHYCMVTKPSLSAHTLGQVRAAIYSQFDFKGRNYSQM